LIFDCRSNRQSNIKGPMRYCTFILLLCGFMTGCQVRKPDVRLQDVKVRALGFQSIDVSVHLEVYNPNWFDLNVGRLSCRLEVDEQELVSAQAAAKRQFVPAGQTRVYEALGSLEYERLLRAWRRYQQSQSLPYRLVASGDFYVLGLPVPVTISRDRRLDHTHRLKRVSRPNWSLKAIRFPGSGRVDVVFEVVNPNDFDLPLIGLSGEIKSQGRTVVTVSRPSRKVVPPGQTVEVAFPVHVSGSGMTSMLTAALTPGESVTLEAHFTLDPPVSLTYKLKEQLGVK